LAVVAAVLFITVQGDFWAQDWQGWASPPCLSVTGITDEERPQTGKYKWAYIAFA